MKRSYFINIRFHNETFNKFACTIVKVDLRKTNLLEIATDVIRPVCEELNVNVDDVIIDVTAFNNIEL